MIGYRLVQTFNPTWGKAWVKYIGWCKLRHLKEIVGLDASLCPPVVRAQTPNDANHVVLSEYIAHVFDNATYLLSRYSGLQGDHNKGSGSGHALCIWGIR